MFCVSRIVAQRLPPKTGQVLKSWLGCQLFGAQSLCNSWLSGSVGESLRPIEHHGAARRPPLQKLRVPLADLLGEQSLLNGCVVPEAADESSGFGGIIAPPWWDDFQEP